MNWYVFYAVAIGLVTVLGAGLAGHLAAKVWWHKWVFWGSGLVIVVLIYFQARSYKEPPSASEIARAVVKQMHDTTQLVQGVPPETTDKQPEKKKPRPVLHKPSASLPSEPAPPSGNRAQLNVTQSPKTSTRPDAPFQTEVVVQTNTLFPSLKFTIQCNKPLVDGAIMNSGIRMMTSYGVLKEHPNIFIYSYETATPPFGPANPLVIELWSKEPIVCKDVATF